MQVFQKSFGYRVQFTWVAIFAYAVFVLNLIASQKVLDDFHTASKSDLLLQPHSLTTSKPKLSIPTQNQISTTKQQEPVPDEVTDAPVNETWVKETMAKLAENEKQRAERRKEESELLDGFEKIRLDWFQIIQTNPVYHEIPSQPLRVGLVTRYLDAGPTNHVFLDGLNNSDYLQLDVKVHSKNKLSNIPPQGIDLWLVDTTGVKVIAKPNDFVHKLLEVKQPKFHILFLDYSDRLVGRQGFMKHHYPDLNESEFQQPHMRFGLRSIVKGRLFKRLGEVVPPTWEDMLFTKQGPPFHSPFAVRTDFVNSLQDLIPEVVASNNNSLSQSSSSSTIKFHPVDCTNRDLDIVHLWDLLFDGRHNDMRNLVTARLRTMATTLVHPVEEHRKLRIETKIQGKRAHEGRWGVSEDYAMTMLKTKIAVVVQRDQWEDHFRLFEGLASGAMVLMDEMLSLPHSLKDGESVVFFQSLDDMEEKALYYLEHEEERLAIARKGWEISMREHRSWHRLEEMLFGKGLTKTRIEESWFPN